MDRVATPWLIKRFVDPEAEFYFVPWEGGFQGPEGAVQVAIPGSELGPHDDEGTAFEKVLRKFDVSDAGAIEVGKVVAAGVAYVLKGYRPAPDDRYGQIGVGLLAMSDGIMMLHDTDRQVIEASLPMYDALRARLLTEVLMRERGLQPPDHRGQGRGSRNEFFKALLQERPR
jgi:hypothetical protein